MEIITKRFIRHGDDRGQLIAIEGDKDLGFPSSVSTTFLRPCQMCDAAFMRTKRCSSI